MCVENLFVISIKNSTTLYVYIQMDITKFSKLFNYFTFINVRNTLKIKFKNCNIVYNLQNLFVSVSRKSIKTFKIILEFT